MKLIRKIFNPAMFQGSLSKKGYFEGWYFKQVSADESTVFSFIPGISLANNDRHAFIQIIDGTAGKSWYVRFECEKFSYSDLDFFAGIDENHFSETGIYLDIKNSDITVKGELRFSNLHRYPTRWFSPGIMGWYSFIPFMECKHGVVSASHSVKGSLQINNRLVDFNHGKGYIEKDWGRSFPESWIWLQCNNFSSSHDASFMVSVAKIPWMGKFFIGFLGFLVVNGEWYPFATYNGYKIGQLKRTGVNSISIKIRGRYTFDIEATQSISGTLVAPNSGNMERHIKESVDSTMSINVEEKSGSLIFCDTGVRAGLEIIEKIFEYF